jgi:hypothetical protein
MGVRMRRVLPPLALLAAVAVPGCASDGTSAAPSTVAEQREVLAARREASRSALGEATGETGTEGASVLDWLGGAAGSVLDLVSLQTFGVW